MLLLIYRACLVNEAMRCVLLKHASDSPTQLCFGTSNAQPKVPPYRFSHFKQVGPQYCNKQTLRWVTLGPHYVVLL